MDPPSQRPPDILDDYDDDDDGDDGDLLPIVKLCLCGNMAVGKSSILKRYCDNTFVMGSPPSTIGVDFKVNTVRASTGKLVKLQISDLAGQERFHSVVGNYFKSAHAIMFVFDVGDLATFSAIERVWMEIARWFPGEEDGVYGGSEKYTRAFLVGNKVDLDVREVQMGVAETLAKRCNMHYIELSAKENINVRQSFQVVADTVAELHDNWSNNGLGPVLGPRASNTVTISRGGNSTMAAAPRLKCLC
jgi:small GTP-binding protein